MGTSANSLALVCREIHQECWNQCARGNFQNLCIQAMLICIDGGEKRVSSAENKTDVFCISYWISLVWRCWMKIQKTQRYFSQCLSKGTFIFVKPHRIIHDNPIVLCNIGNLKVGFWDFELLSKQTSAEKSKPSSLIDNLQLILGDLKVLPRQKRYCTVLLKFSGSRVCRIQLHQKTKTVSQGRETEATFWLIDLRLYYHLFLGEYWPPMFE